MTDERKRRSSSSSTGRQIASSQGARKRSKDGSKAKLITKGNITEERDPHLPHVAAVRFVPPSNTATRNQPKQKGGQVMVSESQSNPHNDDKKPIVTPPPSDSSSSAQSTSEIFAENKDWGEEPIKMKCPNCHRNIITTTSPVNGKKTWIIFGLLCGFGFWLCCNLIPFCTVSCQDIKHTCSGCNQELGRFKRWK